MKQVLIRSLSAITLLALPEYIFGQGQERVIEAVTNSLTHLLLVISLASLFFLLLVIFRNKYFGYLNFMSGVTLILVTTGKAPHCLLTDLGAEACITAGFYQIAFSVILGWIYQKTTTISPAVLSSTGTISATGSSKKEMTLNVVFTIFILNAVYGFVMSFYQTEFTFSPAQFFLIRILPMIILAATAFLFIIKTQAGWVLGTGYLMSIVLTALFNQISTIIVSLKYSLTLSAAVSIYNAVNMTFVVICLILVLSRSVKDTFRIKRSQIILALVTGLLLSVFFVYISIWTAEITANTKLLKKMEVVGY